MGNGGKGIEIGIASETKAFKQGVEVGIIAPVEDAVEALDSLGKTRGPEELERSLGDAQDASKRLERETKDTAETIERQFKAAYRSLKTSSDEATGAAREGLRNFKDEAKQNFAEVASSFDGTAQGIVDGIQGTLGGAAIAVGGAAGVALGAMAIVGGAVGTALSSAIEADAEASEERIQSMYEAFIESKLNYLTEAQKIDAVNAITGDPEKLKESQKIAKDLGVEVKDVILAQIEAGDKRNALLALANDLRREELGVGLKGQEIDSDRVVTLANIETKLRDANTEQNKAVEAAEIYRSTVSAITGEQQSSNEEIQKANKYIAETPKTVATKLTVDDSELDAKLSRSRIITVNARLFTRDGRELT